MKRVFAVAALVFFGASSAQAAAPEICSAPALSAQVKLPSLSFTCKDNSEQACSSDTPSTLIDDPSCEAKTAAYGKTLSKILTPRWWTTPANALEVCRVHGKPGVLSGDESDALDTGYGEMVQGTDRVRLLVQGDACGTTGISNVFLVVRGDHGVAVTPLFFAYNQGGQEAPFELDVVTQGGSTYALFTTTGHDMNDQYTNTHIYKVDFASGSAAPYALYRKDTGDTSVSETSEPIGADLDETHTSEIDHGHFASYFIAYEANTCDDGDAKCAPVNKTRYSWSGTQFVRDGYDAAHKAYLGKLTAQRACMAHNFDAKKGVSTCNSDLACEANNDLSLLAYKSGLMDRARDYAADAMEYCAGRTKDTAAAEFNYKRVTSKR